MVCGVTGNLFASLKHNCFINSYSQKTTCPLNMFKFCNKKQNRIPTNDQSIYFARQRNSTMKWRSQMWNPQMLFQYNCKSIYGFHIFGPPFHRCTIIPYWQRIIRPHIFTKEEQSYEDYISKRAAWPSCCLISNIKNIKVPHYWSCEVNLLVTSGFPSQSHKCRTCFHITTSS